MRHIREFLCKVRTSRQIELDDRIPSRGVLTVPWCPDRYTASDTETRNSSIRMTHLPKPSEPHSPSLLNGLPALGGAIAAIATVMTVLAAGETIGYYNYLGAAWILPSLSFTAKVNFSTRMVDAFAVCAIAALIIARRWPRLIDSGWLYQAGAAALLIVELASMIATAYLDNVNRIVSTGAHRVLLLLLQRWLPFLWTASGSWLAVQTFERWRQPAADNLSPQARALPALRAGLILMIFLVGLTMIPRGIGKANALEDMRSSSSVLPAVQAPGLEGNWHLLVVLQPNVVLIKLPATPYSAEMRVVPLTSVVLIQLRDHDSP
jgi:hypothetical protein